MGMTFDFGQLVLDNEVAQMVKHTVNGIQVNDETLAVDVIKEMGIGKDYLAHETTFKHMKSQSQAQLIDRRMREDWEASGSPDIYKRAHDKMIEILETYEPPPLPGDVCETIREIVVEAEKEQGVYKKEEEK